MWETLGTIATEEVDFVCTRGGETLYVQVALALSKQDTIKREFGNLLRIKDNYPKIVVSGEHSFETSYEGIEHIYIKDFLSSSPSHTILLEKPGTGALPPISALHSATTAIRHSGFMCGV
jgi:hypothetical protein